MVNLKIFDLHGYMRNITYYDVVKNKLYSLVCQWGACVSERSLNVSSRPQSNHVIYSGLELGVTAEATVALHIILRAHRTAQ